MTVCITDEMLRKYKIIRFSCTLRCPYVRMLEFKFRVASPSLHGSLDLVGSALAEPDDDGILYVSSLTGPPTTAIADQHLECMLKEFVKNMNKCKGMVREDNDELE